jgi:hypothetical protein
MTELRPRPVTVTSSVGAKPRSVRRHAGDTQSVLVLLLTMAATLVAVYDLFLLSFIAR